jgi:hypothetical protein
MIYEWMMDGESRNFGDALSEILLTPERYEKWGSDDRFMFFPIGSVICDRVITETLESGYEPVFINCGWRGEPLDHDLVEQSLFVGARGPHTRDELARHEVRVEVSGDPAYGLPDVIAAAEPNALAVVVRHIKDPADYDLDSMFRLRADTVLSPVVVDRHDIIEIVRTISGARFVLAGSMHAAIVAHAYGVPFAALDAGYVDCPAKWGDWFASIGLDDPVFVGDVFEGREWYSSVRHLLKDPRQG